jgi:hypothetical protein
MLLKAGMMFFAVGPWSNCHVKICCVCRHVSVPGFSGDTVRVYKRPKPSVIHHERLLLVQRQATGEAQIENTHNCLPASPNLSKAKGVKVGMSQTPGTKGKQAQADKPLDRDLEQN